jgi:hypothetical protein
MVLSATYRQSGVATPAALERDADNLLLARGPHQRLSAEMVRDQALAAAGTLVQKIGGESVRPFQPPGLWRSVLGAGEWKNDKGDAAHRRGLYVYWKRGVPYPSFTAFDAPKRETCTVTRTRTTTPLQALVTLNDPVYVEAGRALGARMQKEGGKDDAVRLHFGFRLVTSRAPDEYEQGVLASLLLDLRTHYLADEKAARQVMLVPEPKAEKKTDGKKSAEKSDEKSGRDTKVADTKAGDERGPAKPVKNPLPRIGRKPSAPAKAPPPAEIAENAAWAQIGATLLNLEAAIRRG